MDNPGLCPRHHALPNDGKKRWGVWIRARTGEEPGSGVGDKRISSVWGEYRGILFAEMRLERRARPRDDATKQERVSGASCFQRAVHFWVRKNDVMCAGGSLSQLVNALSYAARVDDPLQS